MDCAIVPLKRHANLSIVETVDFFYPLVDDPYIMGKIAFANVVSDLCSIGVGNIDHINIVLSSPNEFTDQEREIILPLLLKGIADQANFNKIKYSLIKLSINPWCIIGGIATAVCTDEEIITPDKAEPDDVIILTKPLGTQLATSAYNWMDKKSKEFQAMKDNWVHENSLEDVISHVYHSAIKSMSHLNITGARLMHKYKAHACTDITGFGLIGHAQNLVTNQINEVDFVIEIMPVIKFVEEIAKIRDDKKLFNGKAVETSGGLFITIPKEFANEFCREYQEITSTSAFVIGKVTKGSRQVKIIENVQVIEVDF